MRDLENDLADLRAQVAQLLKEVQRLRCREANPLTRGRFYRGVTNEASGKGDTGKSVSRYIPGTTSDSGTDDLFTNELIDVGSGIVIHYVEQGGVFYMTSVECPNE